MTISTLDSEKLAYSSLINLNKADIINESSYIYGRKINFLDPSDNPINLLDLVWSVWHAVASIFNYFISEIDHEYHWQMSSFYIRRYFSRLYYHIAAEIQPVTVFQCFNCTKPYRIKAPDDNSLHLETDYSQFGKGLAGRYSRSLRNDMKIYKRRGFSGVCEGATMYFIHKFVEFRKSNDLAGTLELLKEIFAEYMPKEAYTIQRLMGRDAFTKSSRKYIQKAANHLGLNYSFKQNNAFKGISEVKKLIKNLDLGIYRFSISYKNGSGHACSLIKDVSGKTLIFDSNFGLFEYTSQKATGLLELSMKQVKFLGVTPVTSLNTHIL